MKNFTILFIGIYVSFCSFAQQTDKVINNEASVGNDQTEHAIAMSDKPKDESTMIVSYRVEESVNIGFGGSTTVYTVPSLDMIDKNDLGPNNKRVVTPIYGKIKKREMAAEIDKLPFAPVGNAVALEPNKVEVVIRKESEKYAHIKISNTYERVLQKGYKTVAMLKSVADSRYFADDLNAAARWYCDLFELTTDLDAMYYLRYARSLKFIGEIEKSDEMMAVYERKKT